MSESETRTAPIFVVGAPRTGTTLTMEILNLHPEVHLYNEVHYNERIVDSFGREHELGADELARAARMLVDRSAWTPAAGELDGGAARLAALVGTSAVSHARLFATFLSEEASAHGKIRWGDSSPQDVLYMQVLKNWYPAAKFVGVVRDPRAYLASYKNYHRKKTRAYRDRYNPFTNSLLWRSYMNALQEARSGSFASDIHLLSYESLVSDPDHAIRNLCRFLGLEYTTDMLGVGRQNSSYFAVSEDRKQKGISAGSLDRWRGELTETELWIAQRICSPMMQELGYQPDRVRFHPRQVPELMRIASVFPKRLYNILFRTGKPFTGEKLRRVVRNYRP